MDYDDYKNDPGNLSASEIPRVERMVTEARIGPDFANWKGFVDQAFTIKFPGHGMGPGPKVVAEVGFGELARVRRGHEAHPLDAGQSRKASPLFARQVRWCPISRRWVAPCESCQEATSYIAKQLEVFADQSSTTRASMSIKPLSSKS